MSDNPKWLSEDYCIIFDYVSTKPKGMHPVGYMPFEMTGSIYCKKTHKNVVSLMLSSYNFTQSQHKVRTILMEMLEYGWSNARNI